MEELKAIEMVVTSPAGIIGSISLLLVTVNWLKALRKEDRDSVNKEIAEIKERLNTIETAGKQDIKDHQVNCNLKTDLDNLKLSFRDHKQDIKRIYEKIEELKILIIQSLRDKNKELG